MAMEEDLNEELNSENEIPKKKLGFKTLIRQRWAFGLIAGLVLIHAGIIGYIRMNSEGIGYLSPEVSLGKYQFIAKFTDAEHQPIQRAKLEIHVSLLQESVRAGRILLTMHENKVQQEIEQLLRQANGRDFEDPTLAELKRQIQAMINDTLGRRVVAEVIITDLSIHRITSKAQPVDKKSDSKNDDDWEKGRSS